jgi:hypothetical protein
MTTLSARISAVGEDEEALGGFFQRLDLGRHAPGHVAAGALGLEHLDDLFGRLITEQLAAMLLVIADAVFLHQRQKILRGIPGQGALAEMGIVRQKMLRSRIDISEVTTPSTRNPDLLCKFLRMIDQYNAFAALGGDGRAHHPGRACADHCYIKLFCHGVCRFPLFTKTVIVNRAVQPSTRIGWQKFPNRGQTSD